MNDQQNQQQNLQKVIHVRNISPKVNEQLLNALFEKIGPISSIKLSTDETGKQQVCTIEFANETTAKHALELDGTLFIGLPLIVTSPVFKKESSSSSTATATAAAASSNTTNNLTTSNPSLSTTSSSPSGNIASSSATSSVNAPFFQPNAAPFPSFPPPPPIPLHPHHPHHGPPGSHHLHHHPRHHHHHHHHHPPPGPPLPPHHPLHHPPPMVPGMPFFNNMPGISPVYGVTPAIAAQQQQLMFQEQNNAGKAEEIARTVYVGNINSQVSHSQIVDFFSVCGPVAFIRMAGDEQQPTRFAFIEFMEISAAQTAMTLSGQYLADRPIKVNRSKNAIVKPPVKLTHEEQRKLNYAIKKLNKKIRNIVTGVKNEEKKEDKKHGEEKKEDRKEEKKEEKRHRKRSRDRRRSRDSRSRERRSRDRKSRERSGSRKRRSRREKRDYDSDDSKRRRKHNSS